MGFSPARGFIFFLSLCFSIGAFASPPSTHLTEKLVDANILAKDKLEFLLAPDNTDISDNKLCYEIGLFSERAFGLTSVAQEIDTKIQTTDLTLAQAYRIKLNSQVEDLKEYCNDSEGNRAELYKRLNQIAQLQFGLMKSLIKN